MEGNKIISALIGLVGACNNNPKTENTDRVVIKALAFSLTHPGADLLIAADCTAYAHGNFHNDFMKDRITLIGCPKLDAVDYSVKLTEILKFNDIKSVTLVRMEVPCCGGLEAPLVVDGDMVLTGFKETEWTEKLS